MPKPSKETINSLYREYKRANEYADCYVDVSGISSTPNKTNFKISYCPDERARFIRVVGFSLMVSSPKDYEVAFEILFGPAITPGSVGFLIRYNEAMQKYSTSSSWIPALTQSLRQATTALEKEVGLGLSKQDTALSMLSSPLQCKPFDQVSQKSFADLVHQRAADDDDSDR